MPKQGDAVYRFLQSNYSDKMPKMSVQPKTAAELEETATLVDNSLSAQVQEQIMSETGGQDEQPEPDPEAQARILQQSDMLNSMAFEDEQMPSKRRKANKGNQQAAAQAAAAAAPSSTAAATATPTFGGGGGGTLLKLKSAPAPSDTPAVAPDNASTVSGGSKKRGKGIDADLADLDEDMQKVAKFHIQHGSKAGSCKSLATLRIEDYMDAQQDHGKGHALPPVLASDAAGRWIVAVAVGGGGGWVVVWGGWWVVGGGCRVARWVAGGGC